jgi:hypothetical protein
MSQSGSRGRQGKKPGRQTTDGSRSQGRANGPKDRKDATQGQEDQDASTAYRIVKTRQSANALDAAVVADDDPATAWTTKPGTTPDEAWVVLDLGTPRTVGSVRWRVAADGLVGALRIEVSTDGKRWKKAAGGEQDAAKGDQEAAKGWQELRLKQAVDARYVRLVFTNRAGAPRLGGLAEVEVWPAATSEAKGSGAHEDRQRGTSGQAKAKPKQAQAKSGRERAKSGKQHNESKNQQGSTEPPQEPPPGDTDPQ